MRRQARVTVVEADDEMAGVSERLAHLLVITEHLRAEAHDEQDRWIRRITEGLIGQIDAPERGDLHALTMWIRNIGRIEHGEVGGDVGGHGKTLEPPTDSGVNRARSPRRRGSCVSGYVASRCLVRR